MLYLVKVICYSVIVSAVGLQFSACVSLTQEEYNIIAGSPLKLVCNIGATITNGVTITTPDNVAVVSCTPTIPFPPSPASCSGLGVYTGSIDETANTVTVTTNTLPGDVNGTWSCSHGGSDSKIVFPNPIPCLVSENFVLSPSSLAANVTTDTIAFSLIATYSCINVDVTFKWILKAGTSHEFTSSSVSKDSSSCIDTGTCSGVNSYTQTISSDSIFQFATAQNLLGGYELSAEAHYSNGITALKSHVIGYFEFRVITIIIQPYFPFLGQDTTKVEISTATNDGESTNSQKPLTTSSDFRTTETTDRIATVPFLYETSEVTASQQTLSVNRDENIGVHDLYSRLIIVTSSVCGVIVILSVVVIILYNCDRLPISNVSNKYIETVESERHTENNKSVRHTKDTESTGKDFLNIQIEMTDDKKKKYDTDKKKPLAAKRIKDTPGMSETQNKFQFYTGRMSLKSYCFEMSEAVDTQRSKRITGMDKQTETSNNSQMNINDSHFKVPEKYSGRKMNVFHDHDYNYSRRYQQDKFYTGDQHFENRRIHANDSSDHRRLDTMYPAYHSKRHKSNTSNYMPRYGNWSDNPTHDRQQPYSMCEPVSTPIPTTKPLPDQKCFLGLQSSKAICAVITSGIVVVPVVICIAIIYICRLRRKGQKKIKKDDLNPCSDLNERHSIGLNKYRASEQHVQIETQDDSLNFIEGNENGGAESQRIPQQSVLESNSGANKEKTTSRNVQLENVPDKTACNENSNMEKDVTNEFAADQVET
ncbi:unnamed protein product [Mytilus coruscus]|uniref:Ig-like domain-containing protein n=1 Tax=Mytilus coruscus TaxID=42192 RepID=A0A6J8A5J9_MYTCO|nr:unnamed protein product [Mytilus coruscus]